MAKKFIMVMLSTLAVIFVVTGTIYMYKVGVFEPYPEPQYLTAEEETERPLYSQLTQEEKALYTALYRGVSSGEEKIPLPYEIDGDTYTRLYCMLEKQESALFYTASTFYTAEKIRNAKMVYREIEGDIPVMEAVLQRCADEIIMATEDMDDYGKALYIHDYIIEVCKYEIDMDGGLGATAYGCLINGSAHCEGYAKAFDYLAKQVGLNSIVVTGVTDDGENHAWNQVKINGEWYNCDVTWDDTDTEKDLRHVYFLANDEDFLRTHTAETVYYQPFECVNDESSYYVISDLYIESMDEIDEIVSREIFAGKERLELKFADEELYSYFKSEYIEGDGIFRIIMDAGAEGEITISLTENEKELCLTVVLL